MSSWIERCDESSSDRRFFSVSRCLVKLLNCSKAFLLTCEYFLSASLTAWSRFMAWAR
jgi:hypothetical protein